MENGRVDKKGKHKIFSKVASCLFIIGVSLFAIFFIFYFLVYAYDRFFYCYLMPETLKTILGILTFASPVLLLLAFSSELIGLITGGFKKGKIKIIILLLSFIFISAFILLSLLPGAGRCSRSKKAGLTAAAHALRPAISMCCSNPTNILLTTPGADICNPSIGIKLSFTDDFDQKGATINYSVQNQCDNATPTLNIYFSGKLRIPECTNITLSEREVLFNSDCY